MFIFKIILAIFILSIVTVTAQKKIELIDIFHPALTGMVDQLGKQMAFYGFENKLGEGSTAITPYNSGKLYIKINDDDFAYRSSLQTMIVQKIYSKDQELLNGNWSYYS